MQKACLYDRSCAVYLVFPASIIAAVPNAARSGYNWLPLPISAAESVSLSPANLRAVSDGRNSVGGDEEGNPLAPYALYLLTCSRKPVRRFLCTTQPIWTYNTTTSEHIQCKLQSYGDGKAKRGSIFNFKGKKILYMSETYGCAVVLVTETNHGRLPYYELRVREPFVRKGPHEK
ncbi:hypothetical protein MTO96_043536, partial [Rhipicephalus appendiculatus]